MTALMVAKNTRVVKYLLRFNAKIATVDRVSNIDMHLNYICALSSLSSLTKLISQSGSNALTCVVKAQRLEVASLLIQEYKKQSVPILYRRFLNQADTQVKLYYISLIRLKDNALGRLDSGHVCCKPIRANRNDLVTRRCRLEFSPPRQSIWCFLNIFV